MKYQFEFDSQKSASNKTKHGIDFIAAQALWEGRVVQSLTKAVNGEIRYLVTGKLGATYWTAIVTYRGFARRLISVRPSTPFEIANYERPIQPNHERKS